MPQDAISVTLPAALALALGGTLVSPVGAQQNDAYVLVREDDVLSNGDTVLDVQFYAVADDGRWAAVLTTDRPGVGVTYGEVLVVDGVPTLATGDVLATGQTVAWIRELELDAAGSLLTRLEVVTPGVAGTTQVIWMDGAVRITTGPVVAAGLPPGSVVEQIYEVERAGREVLLDVELAGPTYTNAVLRYSYPNGGGPPAVTAVATTGPVLAPLPWPYQASNGIDLSSDGDAAIVVFMLDAGVPRYGVWREGLVHMVAGAAGPLAGTTWAPPSFPHLSCASGGRWAVATKLQETVGGALRSVVVRDGAVIVREGDPVAGGIATFGSFERVGVVYSDGGALWCTAPLATATPRQVLLVDGEVALRSGVSRASGSVITSISLDFRDVAASPDGRRCLVDVTLAGGRDALVSVERDLGQVTPCVAVPNSTGVAGKLRAAGSTYVAANDLVVTAFDLPPDSFGYLNLSRTTGFAPNPGGSVGNLCLGGAIGRFVDQVQSSGAAGEIATVLDLTALPQPLGPVAATAGETWTFQLWHRDSGPSGAVSNFTRSRSVTLR